MKISHSFYATRWLFLLPVEGAFNRYGSEGPRWGRISNPTQPCPMVIDLCDQDDQYDIEQMYNMDFTVPLCDSSFMREVSHDTVESEWDGALPLCCYGWMTNRSDMDRALGCNFLCLPCRRIAWRSLGGSESDDDDDDLCSNGSVHTVGACTVVDDDDAVGDEDTACRADNLEKSNQFIAELDLDGFSDRWADARDAIDIPVAAGTDDCPAGKLAPPRCPPLIPHALAGRGAPEAYIDVAIDAASL
jgi:hypothetical protein